MTGGLGVVGADQGEGRHGRTRHQPAGETHRGQRPGDPVPPGTRGATAKRPAGAGRRNDPSRPARGLGQVRGGRTGRILDEAVHDGLGEPAGRGLEGPHLGQQLAGRGPVAGILGQAAGDQRAQLAGHPIQLRRAVDQPADGEGLEALLGVGDEERLELFGILHLGIETDKNEATR